MPVKYAANAFEFGLVALGWLLLWRLHFSPAARAQDKPPAALRHWDLPLSSFAAAAACVGSGWLLASVVLGWVLRRFPNIQSDDALMLIIGGGASQFGILLGAVGAYYYLQATTSLRREPAIDAPVLPETPRTPLWRSALVTVVITISVVHPVQWLWEQLLSLCHLPTEKQEIVALFSRTESPGRIVALALVAVVVAPVMEEFVFRAGLFRYARGRLPRWLALVLPALFFASLHVNWETLAGLITLAPLAALGIVFSLAYERTGRIAVVMLAHALFNLHTLLFLLFGLTA